ncbi:MAG TPA: hypothetical protein PLC05_01130 [bacterium]|nr:hypothetical protein [bacterium]HPL56089.1 hypothetical protein [bacterium]
MMLQKVERKLAGQAGVDVSREGGRLMVSGSQQYFSVCLAVPDEPVNGSLVFFGDIIEDRRLERASPTALYALRRAGLKIARGPGDRLYAVWPARGKRSEIVLELRLFPPKVTAWEASSVWPEYAPE